MTTLKQLQEKVKQSIKIEFNNWYNEQDTDLTIEDIYLWWIDKINQQTTLAFEAGKAEVFSENGANDMCEYWYKKGKAETLVMVLKEIKKEDSRWNKNGEFYSDVREALDTLKNKLLDNK